MQVRNAKESDIRMATVHVSSATSDDEQPLEHGSWMVRIVEKQRKSFDRSNHLNKNNNQMVSHLSEQAGPTPTIEPTTRPSLDPRLDHAQQTQDLPMWHVILLDDDDHSYEYVIEMLQRVFGHQLAQAFLMACEVDQEGRVIVDTTTQERAELKQEQIHDYGPDPRIPRCSGSMTAVIEPAT